VINLFKDDSQKKRAQKLYSQFKEIPDKLLGWLELFNQNQQI